MQKTVQQQRQPPRQPNKTDRIKHLTEALETMRKNGLTNAEILERITPEQYDFLIDNNIDIDDYIFNSAEEKKNTQEAIRSPRPKGLKYNKKYPQHKQDCYGQLINWLEGNDKITELVSHTNFRDIEFSYEGIPYKIVVSNPRQNKDNK